MGFCTVEVTADEVVVGISGPMRLWALSGGFRLPLRDVREARAQRRDDVEIKAVLRVAGTELPRVVQAGRYWWRGWWEFWAVRRSGLVLVIGCRPGAKYDRVILETDDPEGAAARIAAALS